MAKNGIGWYGWYGSGNFSSIKLPLIGTRVMCFPNLPHMCNNTPEYHNPANQYWVTPSHSVIHGCQANCKPMRSQFKKLIKLGFDHYFYGGTLH